MDTLFNLLTDMQLALLRARGYVPSELRLLDKEKEEWVAVAIKGTEHAEALGASPTQAAQRLVILVARR